MDALRESGDLFASLVALIHHRIGGDAALSIASIGQSSLLVLARIGLSRHSQMDPRALQLFRPETLPSGTIIYPAAFLDL